MGPQGCHRLSRAGRGAPVSLTASVKLLWFDVPSLGAHDIFTKRTVKNATFRKY